MRCLLGRSEGVHHECPGRSIWKRLLRLHYKALNCVEYRNPLPKHRISPWQLLSVPENYRDIVDVPSRGVYGFKPNHVQHRRLWPTVAESCPKTNKYPAHATWQTTQRQCSDARGQTFRLFHKACSPHDPKYSTELLRRILPKWTTGVQRWGD